MDKSASENCDDKLIVVNKNKEYHVSKKFICSSVPYFEKMFCCDLLELKENKVELDFDERVFDTILNWVHTGLFLMKMDYVLSFYEAADYLMINERLFKPCLSYFHEHFTIEHLPFVLHQVTKMSKLINSGTIENFICHHFLRIAVTDSFLDYPVETIEMILKLDLMIHYEYQILESILNWVNNNANVRKAFLSQLLNCVRWSFMDPFNYLELKDNDLIKTLTNFDAIVCSSNKSDVNRSNQNLFVSIHRIDDSKVRINVFDKDLFCLPIGDFTRDESMSLEFVHGEYTSDILFDSGMKGIRIDWRKKTFRWLDFKVAGKTYYSQLSRFTVKIPSKPRSFDCYLDDRNAKVPDPVFSDDHLFLESNGRFITIGKTVSGRWFGIFPVDDRSWFDQYDEHETSFRATILNKTVYILTKNLDFFQFNYETRCFNKSKPFKEKKLDFNHLILTSHQTNDNKVILVNKSSGEVHIFCINDEKWIEEYRFMNIDVGFEGSCVNADGLIAFTSTFIPMKNINPLYTKNFCDNQSHGLKRPEVIERRTSDKVKKPKKYE